MIISRRHRWLAVLALPAVVAGCGSATSTGTTAAGSSSTGSSASTTTAPTTPPPSTPAPPSDAAGLDAFVKSGSAGIRSAHLSMQLGIAGKTVTATGDEARGTQGAPPSVDLTEDIPDVGQLRVLAADGRTFVKVPPAAAQQAGTTEAKPWLEISENSSNPNVRQLATALKSVQTSAAADQFTPVSAAATQVKLLGPEQVEGQPAMHYSLTVDVTKLPDTTAAKQQMLAGGLTTIPADLWVDSRGRPVKLTENFQVQGQPVSVQVTLGNFDAPVRISPPSPAEVTVP